MSFSTCCQLITLLALRSHRLHGSLRVLVLMCQGEGTAAKRVTLEARASCLRSVGRPGQSGPVTCLPFLSSCLFGRKAHWPQCRTLNMGWWGEGERGEESLGWRDLPSCIYTVGNLCVILRIRCVSGSLANNLCYPKSKWVGVFHITSLLYEQWPGWPLNQRLRGFVFIWSQVWARMDCSANYSSGV